MTAPQHVDSSATGASARNLFVEADPEQLSERAAPARPYATLAAAAMLAALLIASSWLGLALRDASIARHSAQRARTAAAAALTRDQARIAELTVQLRSAERARRQHPASAIETAARRARAIAVERRTGLNHHARLH